jgi:hypothetical protein
MNIKDPLATRNLELSCTVGSLDNALEAIEEGADVNHAEGAPLFLAVMNRHRSIISLLLEHGADAAFCLTPQRLANISGRDELIEELVACAPYNPRDVKVEELSSIHEQIREKGVTCLVSDFDWDVATRFRDALNAIGAGSSHRCVAEFLQWARSEGGAGSDPMGAFLSTQAPVVAEYRERYLSSGEDLVALAGSFLQDDAPGGKD